VSKEAVEGSGLGTCLPGYASQTGNLKLETWNKKVFILRPCMIHGPGNKGNLNLLYQVQQKGLPWPLGAYENKRSFCAVDNLIYTVLQLIEKDIEPGIYQVADDEALSTNELIRIMANSQNQKARIWNVPIWFIKALARAGDFLHLPLNSERLKKLTETYVVSNQKLKNALGIEKMPVTAEEGLKRTLESFKE
jgi:nucleoside-diphosphate-sugar epimerase